MVLHFCDWSRHKRRWLIEAGAWYPELAAYLLPTVLLGNALPYTLLANFQYMNAQFMHTKVALMPFYLYTTKYYKMKDLYSSIAMQAGVSKVIVGNTFTYEGFVQSHTEVNCSCIHFPSLGVCTCVEMILSFHKNWLANERAYFWLPRFPTLHYQYRIPQQLLHYFAITLCKPISSKVWTTRRSDSHKQLWWCSCNAYYIIIKSLLEIQFHCCDCAYSSVNWLVRQSFM